MASQGSSTAISSLQRYRPALYILTALAAGCAIYYIHETSSTSAVRSASKQNGLHRSNAQRRRRPRRPRSPLAANSIDHLTEAVYANEDFGQYTFILEDGSHSIRFRRSMRRDFLRLVDEGLIAESDQAAQWREISRALLSILFYHYLTPFIPSSGDREAVRDIFWEERKIEKTDTDFMLDLYIRGHLHEFISGWVSSQERATNLEFPQIASSLWLHGFREADVPTQDHLRTEAGSDVSSEWSLGDHPDDEDGYDREGHDLLNLLYRIAEEQARRDGYIHRGITCNSCSAHPIKGIRYRCSNCFDYDLCESCEASGVHPRTHLFYKVRIPRPHLGHHPQQVKYPGNPAKLSRTLSRDNINNFSRETGFKHSEIEGLWEQFRCLAATEWPDDPHHFHMAINRRSFEQLFIPANSTRPCPPNLVYDRIFSFYDSDRNNLIGFHELIMGLSNLNKRGPVEKWKRIFQGFDVDADGYIDRRDMFRLFRAHYALSQEMISEMIAGMEQEANDLEERELVSGSQPLSSAFSHTPNAPRAGSDAVALEGKMRDSYGDDVIKDQKGVLQDEYSDDENGGPENIVAQHAESRFYPENFPHPRCQDINDVTRVIKEIQSDPWPPKWINFETHSFAQQNLEIEESEDSDRYQKMMRHACHSTWALYWQRRQLLRVTALKERRRKQVFFSKSTANLGFSKGSKSKYPEELKTCIDPESQMRRYSEIPQSDEHLEFQTEVRALINELDWPVFKFVPFTSGLLFSMENDFSHAEIAESLRGFTLKDSEIETFIPWFMKIAKTHNVLEVHENGTVSPDIRSRRSRSSSKVRFEDGLPTDDEEHETRSVTSVSSRSIPVNERWGGFEPPEPEEDVGREFLYQAVEESLNEIMDPIFQLREDLWLEARATESIRRKHAKDTYKAIRQPKRDVLLPLHDFLRLNRTKTYPPIAQSFLASQAYSFRNYIRDLDASELTDLTSEQCPNCEEEKILFYNSCKTCGRVSSQIRQHREKLQTEKCKRCAQEGVSSRIRSGEYCDRCSNASSSARAEDERVWRILKALSGDADDANDGSKEHGREELRDDESDVIENTAEVDTESLPKANNELEKTSPSEPGSKDEMDLPSSNSSEMPSASNGKGEPHDSSDDTTPGMPLNHGPDSTTPSIPARTSSLPATTPSPTEPDDENEYKDPTLPQNRPNTLPSSSSPLPSPKFDDKKPTRAEHIYFAALTLLSAEDELRGGPGRISRDEFLELMMGERGKGLEFVGEWIGLTAL